MRRDERGITPKSLAQRVFWFTLHKEVEAKEGGGGKKKATARMALREVIKNQAKGGKNSRRGRNKYRQGGERGDNLEPGSVRRDGKTGGGGKRKVKIMSPQLNNNR